MRVQTEPYVSQNARWPKAGRHILAHFDAEKVVVYQAYCPSIGLYAAGHRAFGGEFSLSRMSWIKPNFLWMMYRCGWATKKDQEIVLAVSLKRSAFDEILAAAVHSSFVAAVYGSHEQWEKAVAQSDVRLQWDPDHEPSGNAVDRRAIQLGMRGTFLVRYAREWIVDIEDVTPFVQEQYVQFQREGRGALVIPREDVYPIADLRVAAKLEIDSM